MTAGSWTATEDGVSERAWLREVCAQPIARLDPTETVARYRHIVMVSAHPDDETLGLGAFVAQCALDGCRITFVTATDGEASHPRAIGLTPAALAAIRRVEHRAATDRLAPGSASLSLGLPDGGLGHPESGLTEAINRVLAQVIDDGVGVEDVLVLAPYRHDGHGDHDAVGESVRTVCRTRCLPYVFYPVWLWQWCEPGDLPWGDVVATSPSATALHRRDAAMSAYVSQTSSMALPADQPPMLGTPVIRRSHRVVEFLIDPEGYLPRTPVSARIEPGRFDAMFDGSDDPWNVETAWYERRRQALIEAAIPLERWESTLDVGCSTGRLTAALAARSSAVVAIDQSERALEVARRRSLPSVEWRQGVLPEALNAVGSSFEVAVLSEVGYFLDGLDLWRTLGALDACTSRYLVTAHWQHPTRDIPLDGVLVARQIERLWPVVARYEDEDVTVLVSRLGG